MQYLLYFFELSIDRRSCHIPSTAFAGGILQVLPSFSQEYNYNWQKLNQLEGTQSFMDK